MAKPLFTATCGSVAHELGCDPATVRLAVDAGYVPSVRDAAGRRLLPPNAAEILRARREATGAIGCRRKVASV